MLIPITWGTVMRGWSVAWLIGSVGLGCTGGHLQNGDAGPAARAPDGSAAAVDGGAAAVDAGAAAVDAGAPRADAGAGGGSPPAACPFELELTDQLTLAPAAAGQHFVRCATASTGPERWHVTVSPDGAHLAARTSVGTARLVALDGDGWREVAQLASPVGRLDAAAFSPDGAHLALLSNEAGEITLWRTSDGGLEQTFAAPPGGTIDVTASALAFSPDGRRLATSLGTTIDLASGASAAWDLGQSGIVPRVPATLTANPEDLGDGSSISVLRFSADGALLFVDERYGIGNSPWTARLTVHDQASGATRLLYEAYDRGLLGYALSPDGARLAVGSSGEGAPAGLRVVDLASGAVIAKDASFAGMLLAYTADGGRLLARQASTLEVRDASSLAVIRELGLPDAATFLALSPDGAAIVTTADATVWIDLDSGSTVRRAPFVLTEVGWSADGRFGAGVAADGALVQFDRGGGSFASCVAAAPGSPGGSDVSGFTALPSPSSSSSPVVNAGGLTIYWATTAPDGSAVAGEVRDSNGAGRIGIWSLPDGIPRWTNPADLYRPGPIFTADGRVLIALLMGIHTHATDHAAYAVWDASTGDLLRAFGADVGTLLFSGADAAQLATREPSGWAVWCR